MTTLLRTTAYLLFFTISISLFTGTVFAQSRQMLSVTPPLFQLSVAPGDIWQSSVKVVNGNQHELTVYAEIVRFAPQGERGHGKFLPIEDADDTNATLASWIEMPRGPYRVAPEQTREIQFFVDVPEDAPPGGHFAAILISTEPPATDGNLAVRASQVVTTLFFARIDGDIVEDGAIREFSVSDTFVEKPEAEFSMRFENKGNVHLRPRGNIVITNMWGRERGVIPINNQTHFGNVLPESIREFQFSWKGEQSFTDIGRYKAVATLAYGEDGIQNDSVATYFWVIPVKATLITIGSIILFILFVTWAIKLYIRRMLTLAGVDVDAPLPEKPAAPRSGDVRLSRYEKVSAPLRVGATELREGLQKSKRLRDALQTVLAFIGRYKIFFISAAVIVLAAFAVFAFMSGAFVERRNYEVTIDRDGQETRVSSEEIIHEQLQGERMPENVNTEQHFELLLVNESGEAGVAANAALRLEDAGYAVTSLESALDVSRPKTIIVYDADVSDEAQALSELFGNALLSAAPKDRSATSAATTTPNIKIFFGKDQIED